MNNNTMTLADFERLLDVYGGDRTRWPAEARAAAGQLAAREVKAHRLLAEAEALDRVLERAPLPGLATEAALADRIVTAAQRSPRIVKLSSDGQGTLPDASAPAPSGPRRRVFPRQDIRAAAVLAASLMAGIFIGLSNVPQSVLPGLADLVGIDRGSYNLAQVEPFDEDVL
jgi:hypothetical protein